MQLMKDINTFKTKKAELEAAGVHGWVGVQAVQVVDEMRAMLAQARPQLTNPPAPRADLGADGGRKGEKKGKR